MTYYVIGAFGRALCIALLALVLIAGQDWPRSMLSVAVMALWTAYAFVSGIVAVPYNDIVARSIPSDQRSRLLATRFFGGGVLALAVAVIADHFVGALMFVSSGIFTAMGEPETERRAEPDKPSFLEYLKEGLEVFRADRNFKLFVYAQWCGGAVLMAMPFYVVQAGTMGFDLQRVALLLGAQTFGALASNFLWGWWGDRRGKSSLLKAIAVGRIFPPAAILVLAVTQALPDAVMLIAFVVLFFVLGARANGLTIAVIGFLMEISPDDRRPAYSGYFNAITAPAFLLPLLAGCPSSRSLRHRGAQPSGG